MANRTLRDWSDSYRFEDLSPEAEVLFVRLVMKADDYGNFHGDPRIVESFCFPLGTKIKIEAKLDELASRGLIQFYIKNDRKYLTIINFGQRMRHTTRKFPDPGDADVQTDCGNLPQVAANCGELRPEVEEKRSRREVEVEGNKLDKPTRSKLTDDEFWKLMETTYPHANITSERRKMEAWIVMHPGRILTQPFATKWLNRVEVPLAPEPSPWDTATIL